MGLKTAAFRELAKHDEAARFFLKTPAETSADFAEYVKWINTAGKLDYGCALDTILTPPLPGDYISIMGRPGNKKTKFMLALARRYAMQIKDSGKDEAVIYATWDEAVENIESYLSAGSGGFDSGDVAWGRVTNAQAEAAAKMRFTQLKPLWVWGVSIMDKEYNKPPFTADWLFKTVQSLKRVYGITVKALFLDYLQIMPVLDETTRTAEVATASKSAKMLAKDIGCPVFAGVQAGRNVDNTADKIPSWADAQHASQIEQDSVKQLAMLAPVKYLGGEDLHYLNIGRSDKCEPYGLNGKFYQISDDLTVVRILKQRGARGAGTVAIGIDQTTLDIYDVDPLEVTTTKLEA